MITCPLSKHAQCALTFENYHEHASLMRIQRAIRQHLGAACKFFLSLLHMIAVTCTQSNANTNEFLLVERGVSRARTVFTKPRAVVEAFVLCEDVDVRVPKFHPRYRTVLCCSARTRDTASERRIDRRQRAPLSTNHLARGRRSRDRPRCSARSFATRRAEEAWS